MCYVQPVNQFITVQYCACPDCICLVFIQWHRPELMAARECVCVCVCVCMLDVLPSTGPHLKWSHTHISQDQLIRLPVSTWINEGGRNWGMKEWEQRIRRERERGRGKNWGVWERRDTTVHMHTVCTCACVCVRACVCVYACVCVCVYLPSLTQIS